MSVATVPAKGSSVEAERGGGGAAHQALRSVMVHPNANPDGTGMRWRGRIGECNLAAAGTSS